MYAEIHPSSQEREENVFPQFDHDGQGFIVDVAVKSESRQIFNIHGSIRNAQQIATYWQGIDNGTWQIVGYCIQYS